MEYKQLVKVILVGSEKSGKSAFLSSFTDERFDEQYKPTIGIEFAPKQLNDVKFQIWDTAGQEKFRSITHSYYKGASLYCLVVDLTDPEKLEQDL